MGGRPRSLIEQLDAPRLQPLVQMPHPAEQTRVLRPGRGPLGVARIPVEDLGLELAELAQRDAELVEERAPAVVGREPRAQFQRLGGRSSTRRPRQYFTFPPAPPPER